MGVVIAAVIGLMLGSFLSVLLDRWPHWRGAGAGRSHCPRCGHVLAWYDLIPLLSWLSLRGACRYCRAPISALYPALELVMATTLGFYAFFYGVPAGWHLLDVAVLFALVSLFFFDLKHQMLPDAVVFPLGAVVLVRLWVLQPELFVSGLATGGGLAAVFGLLYAFSRGRWLGFGDVKLAFVLGALFGFPLAVGVTLIAVWAGALFGLLLMATGRATMQSALPFGSFWTAAAVVTLLWPAPALMLSSVFIPAF